MSTKNNPAESGNPVEPTIHDFLKDFKVKLSAEVHPYLIPEVNICNPFLLERAFKQGLDPDKVDIELYRTVSSLDFIMEYKPSEDENLDELERKYCPDYTIDISCWLKNSETFKVSGTTNDMGWPDYATWAWFAVDDIGRDLYDKYLLDSCLMEGENLDETYLNMFNRSRHETLLHLRSEKKRWWKIW